MITLAFIGSSLLVITMPGPDLALITRLVFTRRRLQAERLRSALRDDLDSGFALVMREYQIAVRLDYQRVLAELTAYLPETQRVAVLLRHLCELTSAEIAEVTNCPEGTVRSHICRGLSKLRALLIECYPALAADTALGALVPPPVEVLRLTGRAAGLVNDLLPHIRFFRIDVSWLQAVFKLSQGRDPADIQAQIRALRQRPTGASWDLANLMAIAHRHDDARDVGQLDRDRFGGHVG